MSCAIDSASPRPCSISRRSPNASRRCRRASIRGRGTPSRSRRSTSSSALRCSPRSTTSRSISLIADEAHHLTPGTDRGAAISRLASRAPWCVLVSATPHSGDRAAFDYLTRLGDAGDAHRRSSAAAARRRPDDRRGACALLGVRRNDRGAERCCAAIERYARAIWQRTRRARPRRPLDRDHDGAARRSSPLARRAHAGAPARVARRTRLEPTQAVAAVGGGRRRG